MIHLSYATKQTKVNLRVYTFTACCGDASGGGLQHSLVERHIHRLSYPSLRSSARQAVSAPKDHLVVLVNKFRNQNVFALVLTS